MYIRIRMHPISYYRPIMLIASILAIPTRVSIAPIAPIASILPTPTISLVQPITLRLPILRGGADTMNRFQIVLSAKPVRF